MKRTINDYETLVVPDEKGRQQVKTTYRGDYYEVNLSEEELVHFRKTSLVLLAICVILHICAGFIDNEAMNQSYVALPYVFGFLPLFHTGLGVLRLPMQKRKYRQDEISNSFNRMKVSSRAFVALLAIGVLGEILFLLTHPSAAEVGMQMLCIVLEALSAWMILALIQMQKKINIHNYSHTEKH